MAEVQRLWQFTTHFWHQVSPHSGIFVPIPANVAVFWVLLGTFPVGRLYSLYQMHSMQGGCFSSCGIWTPQTPLSAPGDLPYFLTRALPSTELWNLRLLDPLFVKFWWYRNPLLFSHYGFGEQISCLIPCKCFQSLSLFIDSFRGVLLLQDPIVPHSPSFFFSILFSQKQLPTLCSFSHLQVPSLHLTPAEFCFSSYADCCVNPEINFLDVENGLVLI